MGRLTALVAITIATAIALPLSAQWPGAVQGRVLDAESGAPVPGASVELEALGRSALTDATGAFHLRGLEAGEARLRISRIGYRTAERAVEIGHGRTARVTLRLEPSAIAVAGVMARAERAPAAARVERAEIERTGARNAGEVVERLPGVAVRQAVPGGRATVSVRGGGSDAVLVLIDGVPANDPVTGEADLGSIPSGQIESVTLLRGARSARYGPRAGTGVVLIETRAPRSQLAVAAGAGSLGERRGAVDGGVRAGATAVSGGVEVRVMEGAFEHPRLPGADDRPVERENADLVEGAVRLSADLPLVGGTLRLRGGAERMDRGLPGLGHTPSRHARHDLERGRGSLAWRRSTGASLSRLSLSAVGQSAGFADPAPPFGHPYDTRVDVGHLHLQGETTRTGTHGDWGVGAEATLQRVAASGLSEEAPGRGDRGAAFLHGRRGWTVGEMEVELAAEGRVDRDRREATLAPTHSLTISARREGVRAHLAHRSGFTPPSLGDLFFREGVASRPNPDLRPERVPAEVEAGVAATVRGRLDLEAGGEVFLATIRDMVVWAPDFRFVWSPRNRDVARRGADLWLEATAADLPVRVRAHHGYARTTYTQPGLEGVQLAYRPRHLSQLAVDWRDPARHAGVTLRRVGARNTGPSTVNRLPGFWTLDLAIGREWRLGSWQLAADARIERALDERTPFIHDFPDPGRRLRIEGRLHRNHATTPLNR
jgi:outer membrane cobalamin receptor